jgi:hypothetical protein
MLPRPPVGLSKTGERKEGSEEAEGSARKVEADASTAWKGGGVGVYVKGMGEVWG